MPLIIRFNEESTPYSGSSETLSQHTKMSRAVDLFVESLVGVERAATMTKQEKVDLVAETLAREVKARVRNYRRSREIAMAAQLSDSIDDV